MSKPATIHCLPLDSAIMPCCGKTPFDVTGDRITNDIYRVTCREKYIDTLESRLDAVRELPYKPGTDEYRNGWNDCRRTALDAIGSAAIDD